MQQIKQLDFKETLEIQKELTNLLDKAYTRNAITPENIEIFAEYIRKKYFDGVYEFTKIGELKSNMEGDFQEYRTQIVFLPNASYEKPYHEYSQLSKKYPEKTLKNLFLDFMLSPRNIKISIAIVAIFGVMVDVDTVDIHWPKQMYYAK